MTVTITLGLSTQDLLDHLTTAIEWSCARGYWGQIESYKWMSWFVYVDEPTKHMTWEDHRDTVPDPALTDETVLCRIRDVEDGSYHRHWVPVTLGSWRAAFEKAIETHPHRFSLDVSDGKITEVDCDVIGADVALQIAVLKEAVYG
jgi:hypothetical protein